jgi:tRNA A-37 threonylcarbamoyl transferase component Bud32
MSAPLLDATALRAAGRSPPVPFRVALADSELTMIRLLRVLPGKRIVGEAEFAGVRVLAKLFVASGSERHWRQEVDGISALQAANIPTPAMVASSSLPGGGHAVLTEYLSDAVSLADAWQGVADRPAGAPGAQAVLAPALVMLAHMHAAGLQQGDLHLGNFLRTGKALQLIDGDAVRAAGRSLAVSDAAANLGMLLAQLPAAWDEAAGELLAIYRSAGGPPIDLPLLRAEIIRVRNWRIRDYLGKCVRDCTLFSVKQRPTCFTSILRVASERLAPLLNDPDHAIESGVRLKSGNTCTVAQVAPPGGEVVVKRYNLKSTAHALSRLWRPSRAWHSWREGHRLALLGIATPTPLALVEERLGPLRRRAWLVNEFCPGVSLAEYLSADSEPPVEAAVAIAELFATLARLHISHGDLKATNLLWHAGRVWLIDLDACTQHRSEAAWRQAWRRDRARLLRNWPADSVLWRWLQATLPPA